MKDIIDTADMPTGFGAAVYAGTRTRSDAAGVALARAAGALILGKTVSTEFAWFHPSKTANPRKAWRNSPSVRHVGHKVIQRELARSARHILPAMVARVMV